MIYRMVRNGEILKGTIHGKTIELDRASALPDGVQVTVTVIPTSPTAGGLQRAFGAWADAGEELDDFLEGIRQARKQDRRNIE